MANNEPKVYLDYDQDELDRCYDHRAWAPNAEEIITRWATLSAEVQARLTRRPDISYGSTPDEVLDIYTASGSKAPVVVFIHGGAWRTLSKNDSCYPAEAFVRAGAHFVAVNFANLPKVRLPEMVEQVRRAVAWVYRNAGTFGGDPERLLVAGHSSGGHLAANVLVTDWPARYGLPGDIVKGALCASGMYDLEPVMLSARSNYVKITKAEEAELSPIRHLERLSCGVVVAYGDQETPEFQRQSREFAAALGKAGRLLELVVLRGVNHFEAGLAFANLEGLLARATARLIGLDA